MPALKRYNSLTGQWEIVSSGGTGYTGSRGSVGFTGSTGVGFTGSTGIGFTGSIGAAGPIGFTGSVGYSGSGAGNVLIAGNTAPSSPYLGSQWFDTTSNVIYQYVSDGVSSQWIDISTGLAIVVSSNTGGGSSGTVGYTYSGTTSNATETEIFINGSAGNRYTIDANSSVGYEVNLVGRNSNGSGHAYFKLLGLIRNNAGNVQDVGTLAETIVSRTYNDWVVDARADDTNNSLNIYVQGSAGNTVTWSATMTVTKA